MSEDGKSERFESDGERRDGRGLDDEIARTEGERAAHAAAKGASKRAKKRAEREAELAGMPEHLRKSSLMRRRLRTVVVALVVIVVVLTATAVAIMGIQSQRAVQQDNQTDMEATAASGQTVSEDSGRSESKVTVPDLTSLFGLSLDEAIDEIGLGATESSGSSGDKDGDVETTVTLLLSEEPSDTKSGTPTVYLGLDDDDEVVMAGYFCATASLGYGSLSYQDIINNENIVQQTLAEAGVSVDSDRISLPDDASEYQTYASDGSTVQESYTFEGTGTDESGDEFEWNCTLVYDYTAANASGNLSDTVRQIGVYVYA